MTNGVKHISCFWIHIAASLCIEIIMGYNWSVISYSFASSGVVFISGLFSKNIIDKEGFAVIGKSFVYPHISQIICSNVIAKPFVSAFMNNNKIPFHSPARSGAVITAIAGLIMITIRNSTLMFHSGM